jgi:hypothetical protein
MARMIKKKKASVKKWYPVTKDVRQAAMLR